MLLGEKTRQDYTNGFIAQFICTYGFKGIKHFEKENVTVRILFRVVYSHVVYKRPNNVIYFRREKIW